MLACLTNAYSSQRKSCCYLAQTLPILKGLEGTAIRLKCTLCLLLLRTWVYCSFHESSLHVQVAEANRQWIEEEDGIIDDCTIIVVILDVAPSNSPRGPPTPPQANLPQPISSVARVMNNIARQTSNLLTPETALGRKHSPGKLSLKVNQ